jgi:protein-disulfide isomerase
MKLELYTSSFCGACHAARSVVDEATRLVASLEAVDLDIAFATERAEERDIRATPTIVLTDDSGAEVFRAEGAPSLPQLLTAVADHLPA